MAGSIDKAGVFCDMYMVGANWTMKVEATFVAYGVPILLISAPLCLKLNPGAARHQNWIHVFPHRSTLCLYTCKVTFLDCCFAVCLNSFCWGVVSAIQHCDMRAFFPF